MSTEQHEALKLADDLEGSEQVVPLKTVDSAAAMLRTQHALIVQMHRAMTTGESFSEAIVDAEKFLKGPKT